jgi:hypothetical protein
MTPESPPGVAAPPSQRYVCCPQSATTLEGYPYRAAKKGTLVSGTANWGLSSPAGETLTVGADQRWGVR